MFDGLGLRGSRLSGLGFRAKRLQVWGLGVRVQGD